MNNDTGLEDNAYSAVNHDEGTPIVEFNGMELARRAVRTLVGGLVKQGEKLILKFTDKAAERLWELLEQRLTTSTESGGGQPSPALEQFRNNLNEPEYHSMLTITLSDALKRQKNFRAEVEGALQDAEKPAPTIRQKARTGDNSHVFQVVTTGVNTGDINISGRPRGKRKPS